MYLNRKKQRVIRKWRVGLRLFICSILVFNLVFPQINVFAETTTPKVDSNTPLQTLSTSDVDSLDVSESQMSTEPNKESTSESKEQFSQNTSSEEPAIENMEQPDGIVYSEPTTTSSNTTGIWGDVTWEFDMDTKSLTFTSEGTLGDYQSSPWMNGTLDQLNIWHIFFSEKVFTPENSTKLFSNLTNLADLETSKIDTSKTTNMSSMFAWTSLISALDLSTFDTSRVTDMSNMFFNAWYLKNLDIKHFNTAQVTNMSEMFSETHSLETLDVSSFDTANTQTMNRMFHNMHELKNLNLSNFNTSEVINMSEMFSGNLSLENLSISTFDTSKVIDMSDMFYGCRNINHIDVSNFNTSNVTNMSGMFAYNESLLELNLSNFNTTKVTNMANMFESCMNITELDVSSFDTSNVKNMDSMFYFMAYLRKLDISNFTTKYDDTSIRDMFTSNFFLEEIKMSPNFFMNTNAGLEDLEETDVYTGNWQNIGNGSHDIPTGKNVWTSLGFMEKYNGKNDADTYIWQKKRDIAGDLILEYRDTEGNQINLPKKISGTIGNSYDVSNNEYKLFIEGYEFKENNGSLTGTFSFSEQIISFIYTKKPVKAKNLTVFYQDSDGNKIAEPKTISGNIGDPFNEAPITIEGYSFKEVKDATTTEGILTDKEQSIVFIYTKKIVKAKDLTIFYQDSDGNKIAESKTISGNIGDPFNVTPIAIEGYSFKEVKDATPTEGILTNKEQSIIFIYAKQSVPSKKPTKTETSGSFEMEKRITGNISSNQKTTLPKTGDNQSIILLSIGFLLVILATFSWILRQRKEHR
ncbi:BspA family leucine-rich repeat surface protein [Candidatus Enterococcus lemimoniae]|uniref:Gram-positive cocci surface proteins LPxTG domain-containing protein n=1 Tax=Candidatus Enterococcus lemimoniae TaxID=1834167 RepID=A0ABZ2T1H4_9ENTE|nr:BspA family leucine-rich repeat surface protein [Enterococcus sp. 12C11_DIV0727]OTO69516.1 hypothetical protein A5866_001716 [Enterococcus sp. 12C11_DIV0727]